MADVAIQSEQVPPFSGHAAPPAVTPVPANDRYCVKSKRQRELERKRRAKLSASMDAARPPVGTAPYSASGFTASELSVMAVYVAKRDDKRATKEQRAEAGEAIQRLERNRDERLERGWADAANDETASLAEARGETVERNSGRVRIVSRCGLNQALLAGYLRPNHGTMSEADTWEAARKYREAFEVTNGCTTPSANDQGGGGGVRAPEVRVALAGQLLAVMRKGLDWQSTITLDTICGEARSVQVAANRIHKRFGYARDLLTQAITQVVINLAEERRDARAGASQLRTAWEIEDAVDMVKRATRCA